MNDFIIRTEELEEDQLKELYVDIEKFEIPVSSFVSWK